jgi:outer membrane protein, heavy metal efflux system
MRARDVFGGRVFIFGLVLAATVRLSAQGVPAPAAPMAQVTMPDAVRLTLERNQTLRAQRLAIDAARADAVTANLKPNPSASFGVSGLTAFSPAQLTFKTGSSDVSYGFGLDWTFERGGKRDHRVAVAQALIDVTTRNVLDAERQIRFQAEQAFINVLLAKSTLDVSRQDLKTFSDFVDVNQQRVRSGDLAEGDFLPISVQKLQFETDVSAAEVGLEQARATLRQLVGFEALREDFDVAGDLTPITATVTLEDLKAQALASRPDLLAAQSSVKAAQESASLERTVRSRDVDGSFGYARAGGSSSLGVGVSFELPINDKDQGNIAKADIAVRQAVETEAATRYVVLTDVTSAYAAFQSATKVVSLYEKGYLDQARQSRDITTYAFQRGASSLLSVLDAERTYRDVQLNYRQALATLMTSARQLNFVVGKQVVQ